MDMMKIGDGLKNYVLTPATKGAVEALLERYTPRNQKRGALPVIALIGLGVVIGAGAALMLSPATGKEIRSKIKGLASKIQLSKPEEGKDESDESGKSDSSTAGNNHARKTRAGSAITPG